MRTISVHHLATGKILRKRSSLSGLSFVVALGLVGITAFAFPEPVFAGATGQGIVTIGFRRRCRDSAGR